MATVLATVSYKFKDALGVEASDDHIVLKINDTATVADLQTVMDSLTPVVDAVTGAQIILLTLKLDMNISGAKSTPDAGSEVERVGLINMSQAGVAWKYGIPIPSWKQTLITSGKMVLTGATAALVSWLTTDHTGGTPVSKYGLVLEGALDYLLAFRKHRKAETRRSLETS